MQAQRHPLFRLVTGIILLSCTAAVAATNGSPFWDIMRGMATGLAILGQSRNTTAPGYGSPFVPGYLSPPGYPWPGGPWVQGWNNPPWGGFPGYQGYPGGKTTPRGYTQTKTLDRLQGSWETSKGGLLMVRRNMARLYVTRNDYQDFYIEADPHYLWIWPAGSVVSQRYEHRIGPDTIELRDEFGNTLTLKRYRPGTAENR